MLLRGEPRDDMRIISLPRDALVQSAVLDQRESGMIVGLSSVVTIEIEIVNTI